MDSHHYPNALNVAEMKEMVPFYAWYEDLIDGFVVFFVITVKSHHKDNDV